MQLDLSSSTPSPTDSSNHQIAYRTWSTTPIIVVRKPDISPFTLSMHRVACIIDLLLGAHTALDTCVIQL